MLATVALLGAAVEPGAEARIVLGGVMDHLLAGFHGLVTCFGMWATGAHRSLKSIRPRKADIAT